MISSNKNRLAISLTQDEIKTLETYCEKTGYNKSFVISLALFQYFNTGGTTTTARPPKLPKLPKSPKSLKK